MEEITPIYTEEELKKAETRLAEIRFDCIVKMYDFGKIEPDSPFPFVTRKPLPPQWFALTHRLTLELIKHGDEYMIGRTIKEAYQKLEDRIKEYEAGKEPIEFYNNKF